jgi:hypothetical protein
MKKSLKISKYLMKFSREYPRNIIQLIVLLILLETFFKAIILFEVKSTQQKC